MSPPDAVAAKKAAAGAAAKTLPYTGREYLDSLNDGREIWIYGERVKKSPSIQLFRTARA